MFFIVQIVISPLLSVYFPFFPVRLLRTYETAVLHFFIVQFFSHFNTTKLEDYFIALYPIKLKLQVSLYIIIIIIIIIITIITIITTLNLLHFCRGMPKH
jgi:hypothetical protein